LSLVIGKGVVDWVASRTGEFNGFGTDIGIGWQRDGKIVAGVAYANWNGVNVECHIASDGSKHWATRQYLWTIFDYPFCQLKANRITVCVGEGNKDSRRFVEHLGFEREATLDGAHPSGDLLIFRMLRGNCRWISHEYSQRYAQAA
jgi:RimJ/RimL family protein N-acetyltransferase